MTSRASVVNSESNRWIIAVTLQSLVDNLTSDTLQVSLPLVQAGADDLRDDRRDAARADVPLRPRRSIRSVVALIGSLGRVLLRAARRRRRRQSASVQRQEIFTGMLVYDSMTVFFRHVPAGVCVLVHHPRAHDRPRRPRRRPGFLHAAARRDARHVPDGVGQSSDDVFLAVEMASVPSYVLAGILKGRRRASEAALKYAVYGAGAAGVMLYGISLLAGLLGTAHLPTIATQLAAMDIPAMIAGGEGGGTLMVLVLAGLMIMVGLAFKLSAVPFHFWCPDVFEGASAEVDAFLSVASKAAAMALLGPRRDRHQHGRRRTAAAPTAQRRQSIPAHTVAFQQPVAGEAAAAARAADLRPADAAADSRRSRPSARFIVLLLAVIAAVTCTFGNLAAYGQTNIKRLLAYSTIAHAGYMMMAVAAAVQLAGTQRRRSAAKPSPRCCSISSSTCS